MTIHLVATKHCKGSCDCGVEIRMCEGRPAWDALQSHGNREHPAWDDSEPCPMEFVEQDEESCWWRCASCDLVGPYLFHPHRRCKHKKKDTTDL